MKNKLKIGAATLALLMGLSVIVPSTTVLASELDNNAVSLWDIEEDTNTGYDEKESYPVIQLTNTDLIINGESYSPYRLAALLETAQDMSQPSNNGRQKRFAAAAGIYFIPGVGQIALAATGAVVIGGVTITAGHWAYNTITNFFKEHTKNKSKSTHNKHTKPRPGRQSEKKKQNPKWKKRG